MKESELLPDEINEAKTTPRLNNPTLKCAVCEKPIPIGDFCLKVIDLKTGNIFYVCSHQCERKMINRIERKEVI